MGNKEKMRMCPYCEGTVPLDSSSCRFCGSSFEEGSSRHKGIVPDEREETFYHPPYAPVNKEAQAESIYFPENDEMHASSYSHKEEEEEEEDEEKGHILALALLSSGAMLFTLSLLLLFFSEHGRLVLEWKSRYWSLYMILGAPLLYYGFQKLRKL